MTRLLAWLFPPRRGLNRYARRLARAGQMYDMGKEDLG